MNVDNFRAVVDFKAAHLELVITVLYWGIPVSLTPCLPLEKVFLRRAHDTVLPAEKVADSVEEGGRFGGRGRLSGRGHRSGEVPAQLLVEEVVGHLVAVSPPSSGGPGRQGRRMKVIQLDSISLLLLTLLLITLDRKSHLCFAVNGEVVVKFLRVSLRNYVFDGK